MAQQRLIPVGSTSTDFAAFQNAEMAKYQKIIHDADIKISIEPQRGRFGLIRSRLCPWMQGASAVDIKCGLRRAEVQRSVD